MFFFSTTPTINDLPTVHDRVITIDLDELENNRRGKLDERVYISIPLPRLKFWDGHGVGASHGINPTGLEFALNITTKKFISLLKNCPPRVDCWDREFGRKHVVDVLLNVDYDAEKDEGIISIKCNDRLIHLQNFSVN